MRSDISQLLPCAFNGFYMRTKLSYLKSTRYSRLDFIPENRLTCGPGHGRRLDGRLATDRFRRHPRTRVPYRVSKHPRLGPSLPFASPLIRPTRSRLTLPHPTSPQGTRTPPHPTPPHRKPPELHLNPPHRKPLELHLNPPHPTPLPTDPYSRLSTASASLSGASSDRWSPRNGSTSSSSMRTNRPSRSIPSTRA